MIDSVYVYGSRVLREKAAEVPRDTEGLPAMIEDMFQTMYASNGAGLAAPQIGRGLRMFVVDVSACADEDPRLEGFKKAFINPEIYETGDTETLMSEGCLSLPGLSEEVYRPETIRLRWFDENFEPHDEQFDGYAARVIQHEYDHLDGVLFTDHLPPLRRTLLRGKLSAMSKGKYSAAYKTKQVK